MFHSQQRFLLISIIRTKSKNILLANSIHRLLIPSLWMSLFRPIDVTKLILEAFQGDLSRQSDIARTLGVTKVPAVNEDNITLRFLSSNFIVFTWEGIKGANEYEVIKERGSTRVSTTIRPKEITRTAQVMCSQFTKQSNVLCYEDTVDSGTQYRFFSRLNRIFR